MSFVTTGRDWPRCCAAAAFTAFLFTPIVAGHAQVAPAAGMTVLVDARRTAQRLTFVHEEIPVEAGTLTLAYPKWIPGEHGPTGPIQHVGDLRVAAAGTALHWARDPDDMYSIRVAVPAGANKLTVDFAVTLENTISDHQLLLSWNTVLLYPIDTDKTRFTVAPSVILPSGWKQGSSLHVKQQTADRMEFAPVTLERLIDSPVLAGEFFRSVPLTSTWPAVLDVTADSASALDRSDEAHAFTRFSALIDQDRAMFGYRHWEDTFHVLVSQSDADPYDGLEHEDSPYNGIEDAGLAKTSVLETLGAHLLAHEQSHTWVGKYRRPADLYSRPNYQGPEQTGLLWVYEGLNSYVSTVLATRAGFNDAEYAREMLAAWAASFEYQKVRATTPLEDTAIESRVARNPGPWRGFHRAQDYYFEGALVWLEADAIIRARTKDARSLDTFLTRFFGGRDTGPIVAPYTREDVETALNEVCPYDWHQFIENRIYRPNPEPPTAGIDAAGWKLVYTATPNRNRFPRGVDAKGVQAYTLGITVNAEGVIGDVVPDSPAYQADLGPQMRIMAVDGRAFSIAALAEAIEHPRNGAVSLTVRNFESVRTCDVPYRGGLRYPHLERVPDRPDYLTGILTPRK
jgi:predicted metalloprotease with PDZ domain